MLQYKYEPEKNRIAVFQEGGKEVGEVTYFDHPDCWIANHTYVCLLYTSDAADDLLCVDLGGRSIITKKKKTTNDIPRVRPRHHN